MFVNNRAPYVNTSDSRLGDFAERRSELLDTRRFIGETKQMIKTRAQRDRG
jgi:hypothetical protein